MYFYFLIEDKSGKTLIDALMSKIQEKYKNVMYDCKAFSGIGGFTRKNTIKETKTGKLLNDLTTYLKGFNKSLAGIESSVVIVLDNDERNTEVFKTQLEYIVTSNMITIDHIFAIAVEEIEAWLLGDIDAVISAYPNAKRQILNNYENDHICGTWETLANAIYPGGLSKMKKDCPTFVEKGKIKSEWAKNIGSFMDIENNESPSFQFFITELKKRCLVA